jgi:hypothetical protein
LLSSDEVDESTDTSGNDRSGVPDAVFYGVAAGEEKIP